MFEVTSMSVLVVWAGLGACAFVVGAIRVRCVRRAVDRSGSVRPDAVVLSGAPSTGIGSAAADARTAVPELLAG